MTKIKSIFQVESINAEERQPSYTSLKGACDAYGLSYSSASKGKRIFKHQGRIYFIRESLIMKIKGRENNHSGKKE